MPVLRAPQQQGRPVDAMQPALEARVVHVRLPAVEREGLAAAHDRRQLALRQRACNRSRPSPGRPRRAADIRPRVIAVHVGDVALVAAAQLDAERGDQHQAGEAGGRAHHHLGRDPAAEIRRRPAPRPQGPSSRGEIEIEIGEVVDARPRRRRSAANRRSPDATARSRDSAAPADRATAAPGASPSPAWRNSSGRPWPRSTSSRLVPAIGNRPRH